MKVATLPGEGSSARPIARNHRPYAGDGLAETRAQPGGRPATVWGRRISRRAAAKVRAIHKGSTFGNLDGEVTSKLDRYPNPIYGLFPSNYTGFQRTLLNLETKVLHRVPQLFRESVSRY